MSSVIHSPYLADGLRYGGVAFVVAILAGVAWRRWRGRRLPIGGLLMTGAGLLTLRHTGVVHVPDELVLGCGALALAGIAGDLFHVPLIVRAALALPGAWLVGLQTDVSALGWVELAVAATAVVGGALASDFDRRWRRPSIAAGLLAISAIGVMVNVPDTEAPLAILGPFVLVAATGWPLDIVRLGSGGAFASVGLLAWVAAYGGIGRNGSIVGGLAAVGLLAVEPLSRVVARFRGPLVPRPDAIAAIGVGLAQGALVLVVSRVAGFRRDPFEAAAIAGVASGVALVACVMTARSLRRARPSSG